MNYVTKLCIIKFDIWRANRAIYAYMLSTVYQFKSFACKCLSYHADGNVRAKRKIQIKITYAVCTLLMPYARYYKCSMLNMCQIISRIWQKINTIFGMCWFCAKWVSSEQYSISIMYLQWIVILLKSVHFVFEVTNALMYRTIYKCTFVYRSIKI